MILDPIAAYDQIGPVFARVAERRKPYLNGIDDLVISGIPAGSRSMLDVGSGDGRRARRIARARNIAELVLVEPSVAMQGGNAANVRTIRAEELHSIEGEFHVVTCLWNVLGHVLPSASRVEVLRQFARLASPQGRIFVDVHHRYNLRHYGAIPTAIRFLHDHLSWSETNGDVGVDWDVEGVRCTTRGHVFTHREFRSLARAAGLNIESQFVVDYATGERRRWRFDGHLFYVLRATARRSTQQTS
ncbi:MAG TPA: methyltransferase domain-containing protein [Bryobacteraceae bacterium]|nr:methyltransferase domain-containing protein [Bryobacteraceae bacterium]